MKAMILESIQPLKANPEPLRLAEIPEPIPGEGRISIKITACGVCHTELDEIEGRTPPASLPAVLGHQIVGVVARRGAKAVKYREGARVGVAWIHSACGRCKFCLSGRENLCEQFVATGRDVPGGYAEYTTVPEDFAYALPRAFTDAEAAPLLCAGAIGYRSLRLAGIEDGDPLGLMGFGASGHLMLKMISGLYPSSPVAVFSRSEQEREFAGRLGACWAGAIEDTPPQKIHAMIDTTPVWAPVLAALRHLDRGGRLVVNVIRKEEADKTAWLGLDYASQLWMEKEIKTVANITRRDVEEFLQLAEKTPVRPEVQTYELENANRALADLQTGKIRGAKVLMID